jgi:hypothetical protein
MAAHASAMRLLAASPRKGAWILRGGEGVLKTPMKTLIKGFDKAPGLFLQWRR